MAEFQYGQLLISKEPQMLRCGLSDEPVVIPAGNMVVVGFDNLAHHLRNGYIQPFASDVKISGYVSNGIVMAIIQYLRAWLPLDDMLEDYDITQKDFQDKLYEALEEIGIYKAGDSYGEKL